MECKNLKTMEEYEREIESLDLKIKEYEEHYKRNPHRIGLKGNIQTLKEFRGFIENDLKILKEER